MTPQTNQLEKPEAHNKWYVWAATCGGLGLSPVMPGTVGSLPGLLVGYWLLTGPVAHISMQLLLVALISVFAFWTIHLTEQYWRSHDNKKIVIDELAGQALACLFVSAVWWELLLAFATFRLFDIWKPGPIGWLDRNAHGAFGTLSDDLLAGLAAGLLCFLLKAVFLQAIVA